MNPTLTPLRLAPSASLSHGDRLRGAWLATVDLLHRRRAGHIPERDIDDYVGLRWLEWHGGGLRLTTLGENIGKQLVSRLQL
ncbi:MAG: hypothetical protein V4739_05705 [Pseudomonadota bacterium]